MARQLFQKRPSLGFFRNFLWLTPFLAFFPENAYAVSYRSGKWLVSGMFSYGTLQPESPGDSLETGVVGLPGLVGFHVQGERTLKAPNITQWAEVSYGLGIPAIGRTMSYLAILPLGATYWFKRTAYIDFGAGLGIGFGLSPSLTTKGDSGTIEYSGGAGFLSEARVTGRFWFSKFIALTMHAGLRIYQPTLEAAGQPAISANLVSLTGTFGATYAFGGTAGLGRSFVEVLPPDESGAGRAKTRPAPRSKPAPKRRPKPKPRSGQ